MRGERAGYVWYVKVGQVSTFFSSRYADYPEWWDVMDVVGCGVLGMQIHHILYSNSQWMGA